jgi:excisionase family DNA binding protein
MMLTSKDIARHLNVTEQTVRQYARDGVIPFETTPGGHRRFDLDAVLLALRLSRPAAFEPLDLEVDGSPRLGDPAVAVAPLDRAPRWVAVATGGDVDGDEDVDEFELRRIPFLGVRGSSRFVHSRGARL